MNRSESNQQTTTLHPTEGVVVGILLAVTFSHFLNDLVQGMVVSVYPLFKESFRLSYSELSLISMANSMTASVLQPLVGLTTDRRAQPYSLVYGMSVMLIGLIVLATAGNLPLLVIGAICVGIGSAVFHPEAARVARMVSGGRHGMAQSVFQVGGNLGYALGPIAAIYIVMPYGQGAIAWFVLVTLLALVFLTFVGRWYAHQERTRGTKQAPIRVQTLSKASIAVALMVLGILIFSKYFYLVSLSNFYTFYLIEHFHTTVKTAQVLLFVHLFAVAVGTILGGPIGDRFGRRKVIWFSILGVAPFTLLMPLVGLWATVVLSVIIGIVLASAFSAILVYAQLLLPGRIGMVNGLFFGLAFGMAGIGAGVLGLLADRLGLMAVYQICSFLPLLGLLTVLLPDIEPRKRS